MHENNLQICQYVLYQSVTILSYGRNLPRKANLNIFLLITKYIVGDVVLPGAFLWSASPASAALGAGFDGR